MPRWGDEPVTLDRGDSLYSALAKLEAPGDGLPVVVITPNCRIADNVVTYRLLARAGRRMGAPIAVVTSKPHWRRLAREQGLHAYPSLSALRRARTRSIFSWPERFADALLSILHPAISRQSWPIVAVLALMIGAAGYFAVPVMDITLEAPLENVSRDVAVKVDVGVAAVDPSSPTIPGRVVEHRFTVTDYVETTGQKDSPPSGGTSTRVRTASAEDGARLKELLFRKAQSQSLSELTLRVKQSESLIPHSMQVNIESQEQDRAQGEEGDRIKGTAYVMASAICFANQDLNNVVEREWKKAPPKGYSPVQGALQLSPPEVLNAGARTASLRIVASGRAEPVVDRSGLSDIVRGLSAAEAKAKLASVNGPFKLKEVAVWPAWAPRAFRVEVHTVQ